MEDDWLKTLLGQKAATRLDMVTDPYLRHLLALADKDEADYDQLPHFDKMLPKLQVFSSRRDLTGELAAADTLLYAFHTVLGYLPTTIQHNEALLAAASATVTTPAATPAELAPAAAGAGRKARSSRKAGSASGSDIDSEAPAAAPLAAAAAAETPAAETSVPLLVGQPATVVNTLRMRGVVAWRLELKRVWAQIAGMMQEYRDVLAEAEAGPEEVEAALA